MGLFALIRTALVRGPRRPLAARRPDRGEMGQVRDVPLGMEATDLGLIDKVNSRNDALERVALIRSRGARVSGLTGRTSTQVDAMPEDETYAARFHRAFQKKGD